MNKTLIFPSPGDLGILPGGGESAMSSSLLDAGNVLEKKQRCMRNLAFVLELCLVLLRQLFFATLSRLLYS